MAQKWYLECVSFRDSARASLSEDLLALINEESNEHILHIIRLSYIKNRLENFPKCLRVYLKALNNLYSNVDPLEKKKIIEENLCLLVENQTLLFMSRFNLDNVATYFEKMEKRFDALIVIQKSMSDEVTNTDFDEVGDSFRDELKKLNNSFSKIMSEIGTIKSFVKSAAGRKLNVLMYSFATDLRNQFSKDLEGKLFKVEEVFSDCYNCSPNEVKTGITRASARKLTMIALNLMGHEINESKLKNRLDKYEKFSAKLKSEGTSRNMRELLNLLLRGEDVDNHKVLIRALRRHGWRILQYSS